MTPMGDSEIYVGFKGLAWAVRCYIGCNVAVKIFTFVLLDRSTNTVSESPATSQVVQRRFLIIADVPVPPFTGNLVSRPIDKI